jgi:hypothetical protein
VAHVEVVPEALTAAGVGLADIQRAIASDAVIPPAADPVSAGIVAILDAHGAGLSALLAHAGVLRAQGGAAVVHTATTLAAVDEDNAELIHGVIEEATGSAAAGPTAAPAAGAGESPPAPVLPSVPPLPPPPVMPGEALATLLHDGPGSTGLRKVAQAWRTNAGLLDRVADESVKQATAIAENWDDDGRQRAASNTLRHAQWLDTAAQRAQTMAAAAESIADGYDHARTYTPGPKEFADARTQITDAQARMHPVGAARAAVEYAELQNQAIDTMFGYHNAATDTAATLATPLRSAPPIAHGDDAIQLVDIKIVPRGPITWCHQPGFQGTRWSCEVVYPDGHVEYYWSDSDDSGVG